MRPLVAAAVLSATGLASAEPVDRVRTGIQPDDLADQAITAEVGVAAGGRVTPGGLRLGGHYLYQMSERDWFDGTATFTYGGDGRACYVEQMPAFAMSCDHGVAQGTAVELAASVRRMLAPVGAFRPFARAGIGVSFVRFSEDDLSGVAFPLHLGGGLRTKVAPTFSIVTQAEVTAGLAGFGRGLGVEPQLGFALTAGAEFDLR